MFSPQPSQQNLGKDFGAEENVKAKDVQAVLGYDLQFSPYFPELVYV